jgi:hypothetical protein
MQWAQADLRFRYDRIAFGFQIASEPFMDQRQIDNGGGW